MNWWEWVFSGIGASVVILFLQRWLRSSPKHKSSLTAQGAKVSGSPVASGSGITQTVTETHHHYPEPPTPARTAAVRPEVMPNIRIVGANNIPIHQEENEVFFQSDEDRGYVAAVVHVSNDARMGARNVGAIVKATLIYENAGRELLRVTGVWLHEVTDAVDFRVDDSHRVIVGVSHGGGFAVPSRRHTSQMGYVTDAHLLDVPNIDVRVRLTNADTGDFYCEHHFDVQTNPLRISMHGA